MKKLENQIIKVLRSFATTVKMGSDGDYEQRQAILDDEFVDLTIELVKKLTIPKIMIGILTEKYIPEESKKFVDKVEELQSQIEELTYNSNQ
jgi:hypothetical protein